MENSIPTTKLAVGNKPERFFSRLRSPGVQYIALDARRILFEYFGGLADIDNRIGMKQSTTMMAYSMTKTLTAAAILQLVGKGKIDIDNPADYYWPAIPYGNKVTIRQLLTHTSGIPNPIPLRWVHAANKHRDFNEETALAKVLQEHRKLSFEPGRKYLYSNIGYWLLGKIIEKVESQPYINFMQDRILNPLGIAEQAMSFVILDESRHSKGYLAKYSPFNLVKRLLIDRDLICAYEGNWLQIKNHYTNGPAFGGLVGTAKGFAKFLKDQLQLKSALFDNDTRDLFYTQQKTISGHPINMTLGWHLGYLGKSSYFYKEGGGGGYHCEMRIYPSRKIASVIMVNETSSGCRIFLTRIDREILENMY